LLKEKKLKMKKKVFIPSYIHPDFYHLFVMFLLHACQIFFNVFYLPFFKKFDKYLHISIFVMCTLIVFELLISVKKIVNSAFKYSSLNYEKKSNLVFQFWMKTNENPIQKGHEFQLLITEK